MTQEDKQLLIKDLCARLSYGVICTVWFKDSEGWKNEDMKLSGLFSDSSQQFFTSTNGSAYSDEFKPYLRQMSSMTEEEKKEYESFFSIGEYSCGGSLYGTEYEYIADSPDDISQSVCLFDWLNSHHFDYRGLIEEGLALEAHEGMYKTE